MRWRWHRFMLLVRYYLGRSCGHLALGQPGIPNGVHCDLAPRHTHMHMAGPSLFNDEVYVWPGHPAGSSRETR